MHAGVSKMMYASVEMTAEKLQRKYADTLKMPIARL